jgi:hypothetical protein
VIFLVTDFSKLCHSIFKTLPNSFHIFFTNLSSISMSEAQNSNGAILRLAERADLFAPGMSRKVAQLIPYKAQIRKLRGRKASYDCIRLILAEENIKVSLSTLYRFCRKIRRDKDEVRPNNCRKAKSEEKNLGETPSIEPESAPRDQSQPYPGPWSRRKRGPRIANSKTL